MDATRLMSFPADQHAVDTDTAAVVTATIAAVAGQRVIVTGAEISAETTVAAAVQATLKDGTTTILTIEIPATAIAPIAFNWSRGLACSVGNAAILSVPSLGTGVNCSIALHGFYVNG